MAVFRTAIELIEEQFGLSDRPRVVVFPAAVARQKEEPPGYSSSLPRSLSVSARSLGRYPHGSPCSASQSRAGWMFS